jgi:hypothetical protein
MPEFRFRLAAVTDPFLQLARVAHLRWRQLLASSFHLLDKALVHINAGDDTI